jgi:hypothetical protein
MVYFFNEKNKVITIEWFYIGVLLYLLNSSVQPNPRTPTFKEPGISTLVTEHTFTKIFIIFGLVRIAMHQLWLVMTGIIILVEAKLLFNFKLFCIKPTYSLNNNIQKFNKI